MALIRSLLGGKVKIETWPRLSPVNHSSVPASKRIITDSGELAQIYNSTDPIHLVAYLELVQECIRGGHYHLNKDEWIYIIRGEMDLTVQDIDTSEKDNCKVTEGDLIFIGRRTAHSIKTTKAGHAIEFSSRMHDPLDTLR